MTARRNTAHKTGNGATASNVKGNESSNIYLPGFHCLIDRVIGSPIRQLLFPAGPARGEATHFRKRVVKGMSILLDGHDLAGPVLIVPKATSAKELPDHVLLAPMGIPADAADAAGSRWLRPKCGPLPAAGAAAEAYCGAVRESWIGAFAFQQERYEGRNLIPGLRPPQIGALHSILGHWTITQEPGTVVMPTGTGKTETMLALLIAKLLKRVLVIVPTDPLRDQIAGKFLSLGVLKQFGVVSKRARLPVVGTLLHKPKTAEEAEEFFTRCNVVVTTASIAGDCSDDVALKIASLCSHLIVDEAHHVRAPTWERVRESFERKPILQFTATPYRGDGKLVDGKVVYNYPLKKAQEEGYFKPIRFLPVEEYSDDLSDERIAEAAIKQLDEDLKAGHDHLLMARCATIHRAKELYTLYLRIAAKHKPVIAHSEQSREETRTAVKRLRARESRIVVCVSMFGEGFDLPELKVAALHDVHKSLAVTLQFTGRFTRTKSSVGDATIIANIANVEVEEALEALYSENPDWNHLLRDLSEGATTGHGRRSEFDLGFLDRPDHIPLQNVFPKMSTVVYRTTCKAWKPEKAKNVLKHLFDKPALHPKERVLVLVTKELEPVSWGRVRSISNTTYELYLLHWDEKSKLLYIHSSNKDTVHENLAKAVCGDDVTPLRGERVYRVLHGINRLILMNLGLGHTLSRAVRFTMHVGADIKTGLSEAHAENKIKTNIFGRGFSGGDKASVGCSAKGRIWSFRVAADIAEWVQWCHQIGKKLQDDSINIEEIFKGAIIPEPVTGRPDAVPVTIDWADALLERSEELVTLEFAGLQVPFYDISAEIADHVDTGPIRFRVRCDRWPQLVEYEVRIGKGRVEYVCAGSVEPYIITGRKKRKLSEYLQEEPPIIRFHDGSFLWYDHYFRAHDKPREAFDRARIDAWPWTGVDLKKESQTQAKHPDSIQRHVIQKLLAQSGKDSFDLIFDDDESGESADIVAMRHEDDRLLVRLYHCKYAHGANPGHRVADMYEVCGQAQRSVYWKGQTAALIDHLAFRETARVAKGGVSRFERGTMKTLRLLKKKLRTLQPHFEVYVVQPGLSQAAAETAQLELLAVTEMYLKTTYEIPFGVIASA